MLRATNNMNIMPPFARPSSYDTPNPNSFISNDVLVTNKMVDMDVSWPRPCKYTGGGVCFTLHLT